MGINEHFGGQMDALEEGEATKGVAVAVVCEHDPAAGDLGEHLGEVRVCFTDGREIEAGSPAEKQGREATGFFLGLGEEPDDVRSDGERAAADVDEHVESGGQQRPAREDGGEVGEVGKQPAGEGEEQRERGQLRDGGKVLQAAVVLLRVEERGNRVKRARGDEAVQRVEGIELPAPQQPRLPATDGAGEDHGPLRVR